MPTTTFGGFLDARARQLQDAVHVTEPFRFVQLRDVFRIERRVELHGDVAGHLEVLLLILADGDFVRVVGEDVRRHEHGVREEPRVRRDAFRDFVLVGVRVLEHRHRRDRHEQPHELGHLGDVALAEERDVRVRRIEAEGEVVEGDVARELAELVRVAHGRQRVQVGDEDEALVAGFCSSRNSRSPRNSCRGEAFRTIGCR